MLVLAREGSYQSVKDTEGASVTQQHRDPIEHTVKDLINQLASVARERRCGLLELYIQIPKQGAVRSWEIPNPLLVYQLNDMI